MTAAKKRGVACEARCAGVGPAIDVVTAAVVYGRSRALGLAHGFGTAYSADPSEMGRQHGYGSAGGAVPSEMGRLHGFGSAEMQAARRAVHVPPLEAWLDDEKGIKPHPDGNAARGICPLCPPDKKEPRLLGRFKGRICASCVSTWTWDVESKKLERIPRTKRGRTGERAVGKGKGGPNAKLAALKAAKKARSNVGSAGGGAKGKGGGAKGKGEGGGGIGAAAASGSLRAPLLDDPGNYATPEQLAAMLHDNNEGGADRPLAVEDSDEDEGGLE